MRPQTQRAHLTLECWRANIGGISYKGPLACKAKISHLISVPIRCRFTLREGNPHEMGNRFTDLVHTPLTVGAIQKIRWVKERKQAAQEAFEAELPLCIEGENG